MPEVKAGTSDLTAYFKLVDPTTGVPEIGLVISDLTMSHVRNRAGDVSSVAVALVNASDVHTDWRMFEVDGVQSPGLYRADYPDAAGAGGVNKVVLGVRGAAIDPAFQQWIIKDVDISDLVADHDKTQSDILLVSNKIDSDFLSLEVALDSDFLAIETKLDSDMVILLADHDKTQSGIAVLQLALESADVVAGSGANEVTIVTRSGGSPISNVEVWITRTNVSTDVLRTPKHSDDNGEVVFHLDAGTYYAWRTKAGISWNNPAEIVVEDV